MMTIFINRIWCVKVDPFVGNWSKCRQTETSTTKTSTSRNTDIPKCRQTKTKAATNQNIDIPKHQQTKASIDRNVDRPKHRQTKTSTYQTNQNVEIPKHRPTKNVDIQNVDRPKRGLYNSVHCSRVFVFIILGMYYIYISIHMYGWWDVLYVSVPTTLHISTSKIKSILGGTPGIILKVKDHFERMTINTDVCTEIV